MRAAIAGLLFILTTADVCQPQSTSQWYIAGGRASYSDGTSAPMGEFAVDGEKMLAPWFGLGGDLALVADGDAGALECALTGTYQVPPAKQIAPFVRAGVALIGAPIPGMGIGGFAIGGSQTRWFGRRGLVV